MDYIKELFNNKKIVIFAVCLIISLFLFNMVQEQFDTTQIPTMQNYINQLENKCLINNGHTDIKNKIYWIGNFYGYNCLINDNQMSYILGDINNTPVTLNLNDYDISGGYYIGYDNEGNLMKPKETKDNLIMNEDKMLSTKQNRCQISQQSIGTSISTYPLDIQFSGNSCFNCYINEIGNPTNPNFGGIINATCLAENGSVLLNHVQFNNSNKDSNDHYVLTNNNGVLQPIITN